MSAALAPFDFEGVSVRAGIGDDGAPWFVASDVARVLGHREAEKMTRSLDDDEKGPRLVGTRGGEQRLTVITESGLYSAILSRQTGRIEDPAVRDTVARFKRWVTHEVLPAIRRTGSYSAPTTPVQLPSSRELAAMVIAEADRADAAERRAAELAPAAAAATALMSATGDYSLRDAAHVLSRDHGIDTGQNRLLARLRDIGWVDRRGLPYQEQIGNGRLSVRTRTYDHPHTGEPMISNQLRVTAKGLTWLHAHWPTTTASVTKLAVAR